MSGMYMLNKKNYLQIKKRFMIPWDGSQRN